MFWRNPDTPLGLFLPQHPIFHDLVVARAESVDFLGRGIKVLSATDLMVFKALFARSQDFVDIESLGENRAGDLAEATRWIREILGPGTRNEQRMREAWLRGVDEMEGS